MLQLLLFIYLFLLQLLLKRKYVINVVSLGCADYRESQHGLNSPFPMPGFTLNRRMYMVGKGRKPYRFKVPWFIFKFPWTKVFIYIPLCLVSLQFSHPRTVRHHKIWPRQGICLSFAKWEDCVNTGPFLGRSVLGKSPCGRWGSGNAFPWNHLNIHTPWKIFLCSPCLRGIAPRFRGSDGAKGRGSQVLGPARLLHLQQLGFFSVLCLSFYLKEGFLLLKITVWKTQLSWGTI